MDLFPFCCQAPTPPTPALRLPSQPPFLAPTVKWLSLSTKDASSLSLLKLAGKEPVKLQHRLGWQGWCVRRPQTFV